MDNSCESLKQRGHVRSASLENANSLIAKNTLGLPNVHYNHHHHDQITGFNTGTLKVNHKQRSFKSKFGSYNNLDECDVIHNKSKFQNLKNMFEMKIEYSGNGIGEEEGGDSVEFLNNSPIIKNSFQKHYQQQIQQQLLSSQKQQQSSVEEFKENLSIIESSSSNEAKLNSRNIHQARNLLKPIAFKPIPFEPDYSIPNRHAEYCDRYGSTPSLAPVQGPNLKFGSTSDLRNGYSYCANLARRRGVRLIKMNDSMESVSYTPDIDTTSQSSKMKLMNKFLQDQFDITPSPSDSGISELEAALKDRDSELSCLRQTMEHNEKVIFKVHKDKEAYWEHETKRIKSFYESQQKEHLSKIKKLEQMLTIQSFQLKQNRLRFSEDSNRLKDQYNDLKNENELLRNEADSLKITEKTLTDRVNQLEQKVDVMNKLITNLKSQLEENEWTVCQKNGEIALLKTQLKEAKVELTSKEHKIIHMKSEIQSRGDEEENIYNFSIRDELKSDLEKSQLNRIIILKDQVILALTNELSKLRKELSELAKTNEYGDERAEKYSQLKYKLENLTNICHHHHHHHQQQQQQHKHVGDYVNKTKINDSTDCTNKTCNDTKNMNSLTENDLEIIINCLKTSNPFSDNQWNENITTNNSNFIIDITKSFTIENHDLNITQNLPINAPFDTNHLDQFRVKNLPDVTQNAHYHRHELSNDNNDQDSKMCLMKKELDEIQKTFELEKRQWAEEKEKVLRYQQQLQAHYIHMYQKMKDFENKLSKKF